MWIWFLGIYLYILAFPLYIMGLELPLNRVSLVHPTLWRLAILSLHTNLFLTLVPLCPLLV
jgi:hypothetical protein